MYLFCFLIVPCLNDNSKMKCYRQLFEVTFYKKDTYVFKKLWFMYLLKKYSFFNMNCGRGRNSRLRKVIRSDGIYT